jgi:hypothetical protein
MVMAGRVTIKEFSLIVVKRGFHESPEEIPVLDLLNAKFFVAKYDNDIGDAYTRFLI